MDIRHGAALASAVMPAGRNWKKFLKNARMFKPAGFESPLSKL
jgi:hypothetical protein